MPGQPCRSFPLLPDARWPGGLQGLETDAASCHGEAEIQQTLFLIFSVFPFQQGMHFFVQVAILPGSFSWQPHLSVCSNPLPWHPPGLGCSLEEGPLLLLSCSVLPGICRPTYWLLLLIPMISFCLFIQKVHKLHLSIPLGPAKAPLPAARKGCCCPPW